MCARPERLYGLRLLCWSSAWLAAWHVWAIEAFGVFGPAESDRATREKNAVLGSKDFCGFSQLFVGEAIRELRFQHGYHCFVNLHARFADRIAKHDLQPTARAPPNYSGERAVHSLVHSARLSEGGHDQLV